MHVMLGILLLVVGSLVGCYSYRGRFSRASKAIMPRSSPMHQSTVDTIETIEEEIGDTVDNIIKLGKTVAIFYPADLNISASNPFGDTVKSRREAVDELKYLVIERESELKSSDFLKCRIEYLVKVLKQVYVPSFTVEFMNLAMTGEWDHRYSNVLLRRADESLTCKITQKIIPSNSIIEIEGSDSKSRLRETTKANKGEIVNKVAWSVVDNKDQLNHGDLFIHANYSIGSNGALGLSLGEHIVNANKLTLEPMDLVMAIQRSIPFQFFDPSDSSSKDVYIDPDLRISETSGPIFQGVYDIFVRSDEVSRASTGEGGELGGNSGIGFGKAKLSKKEFANKQLGK